MKEIVQNKYQESINKTIDYINDNLKNPIDLKRLATIANISEFHFHRIFKAFIGEPLGTYIVRLRMERAASILQRTNNSLSEIAEKTGYQSPYSLSKAFKKHFGITPSAFRNIDTFISNRKIIETDDTSIPKPDIREIKSKELVYVRIISKYGSKEDYSIAWAKLYNYVKKNNLLFSDSEFIGLSFDDPGITKAEKCRFYACISINEPIESYGEFGIQTIESGKYAVFSLKGSYSGLDKLYRSIYFNWLPNSKFQLRNDIPFEKYLNSPDTAIESELLTEIFIPIKEKLL